MGLINLITNPENFKFYSGGIGSTSTTYRFGQKSIPFQKDRIYGGKSKQPYIISSIKEPGQFSNFYGDSDFLWAGGVLGTLKASEDSSRLLKYFSDTSNISGNFFIQKQELLSKINPKTEISLKDEPNGGIYLSDSTIFQSQKGFQGFHFLKQGNPSLIDQEVNQYQKHFLN